MDALVKKTRPDEYLDNQGHLKVLWGITLTRHDVKGSYTPTSEAYLVPSINQALESDRYSIGIIDTVQVKFLKSDALTKFLTGLSDPKQLELSISCYLIFYDKWKYQVWGGRLQNLPEGQDLYPGDYFTLTFAGNPYWWGDADDVKDSNTSTWYVNKHVTDTLLPALMKAAFAQVAGSYDAQAPDLRSTTAFWSGYERPIKALAGGDFDNTCKPTAMCWDSTRELLYIGVHDAIGSATLPWIISFDPATREWGKVTQARYGGGKPYLRPPTEWEFQHLEYDSVGDNVYYVCRTNHAEILDKQAHWHCQGVFSAAAPPSQISLSDTNSFVLNDKGIVVRSRPIQYNNRDYADGPIITDGISYYADATTHNIGWGTVHTDKEFGLMHITNRIVGLMAYGTSMAKGSNRFWLIKDTDKNKHPRIGFWVEMEYEAVEYYQIFGRITNIYDPGGDYFQITVEFPSNYTWGSSILAPTRVYMYVDAYLPSPNVFIGKPQAIAVEYIYANESDPAPATITVEGRTRKDGTNQFFWPRTVATVDESGNLLIDRPGFYSFVQYRDFATSEAGADYIKNLSGEVPPFKITLEGYNPTYLIADGFWVENDLQDFGSDNPCSLHPGKVRLMYNGAKCKVNDGSYLETYGDIFLWKNGTTIYAAWNDTSVYNEVWFSQIKVGRWDGTQFIKQYVDRFGQSWRSGAENYLTSFAYHNNQRHLAAMYYEPNWLNTQLQFFWGAPPQTDVKPTGYDGGFVATLMVPGDRTDVFEVGDYIRVGGFEEPGAKEYYISEIDVLDRTISSGANFLHVSWRQITGTATGDFSGTATLLSLLQIDKWDTSYNAQVRLEFGLDATAGGYISVKKGRDVRNRIYVNTMANPVYTATAVINEPAEGGEYAYDELEWQGEALTVAYDDEYPRMPRVKLSEAHVVSGSLTVKLKSSNRTLDLTDYTANKDALFYQNWPVPTTYQCYLNRQQGSKFNETYLYFNPSLLGSAVDVVYSYYVTDAAIKSPIVYGSLYFNESGARHRFLQYGTTYTSTYSPRIGDFDLNAIVAGDRIFAIGVPSYILLQYDKRWTGYVAEVRGEDIPIWQIAAGLARACDQHCYQINDTTYFANRNIPRTPSVARNVLDVRKLDLLPYRKVILNYANGAVAVGTAKPYLNLSADYVWDKGHAEIIANNAYGWYNERNRVYELTCAGVLENESLLGELTFTYMGENITATVTGIRFNPDGTTVFTLYDRLLGEVAPV